MSEIKKTIELKAIKGDEVYFLEKNEIQKGKIIMVVLWHFKEPCYEIRANGERYSVLESKIFLTREELINSLK